MIGANLHRFKTGARYCGWDVEGESLSLFHSRPWQIAWCVADNKEIKTTKSAFIRWPDLNVSAEAARITRFNRDLYEATARPADEVLAEFEAVLYDPSIETVWQNGLGYDLYAHRTWRRALGLPIDDSYLIRSIDLTSLTKALKKGWTPDISSPEAFLAWQYKMDAFWEKGLTTRLEVCAKEEKLDHDLTTLHDALSDIVLMMKVYWKRLFQVEF